MKTLNDLLERAGTEDAHRPAICTAEETLTYGDLRKAILETAAGLSEAGVKKGDCVAIVHRNSAHFVVAYFALNRLGAVAVPINFMVQKAEELAYMLNDCKAVGLVTQKEFLKGLRGAAKLAQTVKTLWVTDADAPEGLEKPFSSLRKEASGFQAPAVGEEDVASILYTSGTTGSPKGVMLTHHNLLSNCLAAVEAMGLKRSDVALCILPMFHSFAWTGNVLISIRMGTKLVIAPAIAPPKPWLTLMAKHGVSLFSAVPQVYAALGKKACGLEGLVLKWWFFRRVRLAISGAAPLSPQTQKEFESGFGVPILEGYGLTETSPVATINTPKKRRSGSVGTAIRDVTIKIVDDQEKELPIGQEGEVCIKGPNIMKGYYNLPEATREAFTADGCFKSGDIGALDQDGFLYIRDRKKDMIIIKGLKVFSAQVEATLLEHPDVAEAAIIGIPDEVGDETIKAFLVLRSGATADKAALMAYCKQKFDAYKRPRDIEIVDALPKNALQKVLKRVLRQQELQKRTVSKA
jgi:long-chain acyl-CoA synthetase